MKKKNDIPDEIWVDWTNTTKNLDKSRIFKNPHRDNIRYIRVPDRFKDNEPVIPVKVSDAYACNINENESIETQRWFKMAYFCMAAEQSLAVTMSPTDGVVHVPAHQIRAVKWWILEKLGRDLVFKTEGN